MTKKEAISDRDNALFEAGIKLGALYHQFIGTPVSTETLELLERTIERSVALQPGVKSVEVIINSEKVRLAANQFKYCELSGAMLDVKVVVVYGQAEVHVRLKYEAELEYPLMRVEKVSEVTS